MTQPITLVLPYPVSTNRYWRQVILGSGKSARPCSVPTGEAKAYKAEAGWRAKAAGVGAPLASRVHIHLQLFPERPQDWAKRAQKNPDGWDDTVRCLDIDNARKVVYDSLTGVVIVDDKQVFADSAERMEPDEHGARVVVTVTPYQRRQVAPGLFAEAAA